MTSAWQGQHAPGESSLRQLFARHAGKVTDKWENVPLRHQQIETEETAITQALCVGKKVAGVAELGGALAKSDARPAWRSRQCELSQLLLWLSSKSLGGGGKPPTGFGIEGQRTPLRLESCRSFLH